MEDQGNRISGILFVLILILACPGLMGQESPPLEEFHLLNVGFSDLNGMAASGTNVWLIRVGGVFRMHFDAEGKTGIIDSTTYMPYDEESVVYVSDMSFFDGRNGIMVGSRSGGNKESTGVVYRTTDNGTSWQAADSGFGYSLTSICTHDNGEAWAGGESGRIYYSGDYGASWSIFSRQFEETGDRNYVQEIEIGKDGYGVIRIGIRNLMVTSDRGRSWDAVGTPCAQFIPEPRSCANAYIEKVGVSGRYALVKQAGKCFYRPIPGDKWHAFDRDIIDFMISENGSMVLVDSALQVFFPSSPSEIGPPARFALPGRPFATGSYGEDFYIVDADGWVSRMNRDSVTSVYPRIMPSSLEGRRLGAIGSYKEILFMYTRKFIYRSQDYGRSWGLWAGYHKDIHSVSVVDDTSVVAFCSDGVNLVTPGGMRPLVSGIDLKNVSTKGHRIVISGEKTTMKGQWPNAARIFHSSVLLVSFDDGLHWKTLFEGRGLHAEDISFINSDSILIIGDDWKVYRLALNGERIDDPNLAFIQGRGPDDLWYDSFHIALLCDPLVIYAVAGRKMRNYYLRTSDGGKNWVEVTFYDVPRWSVIQKDGELYVSNGASVYLLGDDCTPALIVDLSGLCDEYGAHCGANVIDIYDNGDILILLRPTSSAPREMKIEKFYLYHRETGQFQPL